MTDLVFQEFKSNSNHFTKLLGDASGKEIYRYQPNSMIMIKMPPHLPVSDEHMADDYNRLPPKTTQRDLLVQISEFLNTNLPNTPKLLGDDHDHLVLMEDLGSTNLYSLVTSSDHNAIFIGQCYEQMIHWINKLQQLGNRIDPEHLTRSRTFQEETMILETQELIDFLTNHPSIEISSETIDQLKKLLQLRIYQPIANNQRNQLMHRDFQSKNIMIKDRIPYVIDVQDLCQGPCLYDLASLLYDPNANLNIIERLRLAKMYWTHYLRFEYPVYVFFLRQLRLMAVQRMIHVIGRHGSIFQRTGRTISQEMIKSASQRLLEIIDQLERDEPMIDLPNLIQPFLKQLIQ